MAEDTDILDEDRESNMVPEEALKRRLAEQSRKHAKALREQEERLREQYENQFKTAQGALDSQISSQAAANVISGAPSGQMAGFIREDDLPGILAKADELRKQREEEELRRKQLEAENMANINNLEEARQSIINEVGNDPEFKEKVRKHGDVKTLNDIDSAFYELGIPAKHAPKVIKNLFKSDEHLSKFKKSDSRGIDRKQVLLDLLMKNAEDKISNSLPQIGGEFAIKSSTNVAKDPNKMSTQEYRKYMRERGKY